MKRYIRLSDRGAALPAVLLAMLIIMTFSAGVVTLASQQTKEEIYYENDTGAYHAAEAGLHKYLWHLNKESSTLDMDTVILYPEDNPTAAFQLTGVTDGTNSKTVKATGWMLNDPTVMETIEATFQKRSFTQYIYFSDEDPDGIYWTTYDNCFGPYHTNTKLSSKGHPNFWGKVTTFQGMAYYTNAASDTPVFHAGYEKLSAKIQMPANNSELMSYGTAADGYYYEGRTSILLNANGTITIWNPNHSPTVQTRALPANGVIYVNERSGTNYSDKFDPDNGNVFIAGVLDGRITVAAKHDIYVTGYDPTVSNLSSAEITNGIAYKDTTFSLNASTGVLTVNETGGDAEADMLGLIADYNVVVLTQGWFTGSASSNSSRTGFNISAAMMAINGSFINSVFMNGASPGTASPTSPGTLTVRGAIIQNKRGSIGYFNSNSGVTTSGYNKNYAHDTRMSYDAPPHFLKPEGSGWEITQWN